MNFVHRLTAAEHIWGSGKELSMAMTLFNKESAFPAFLPVIVRTKELKAIEESGLDFGIRALNIFPTRGGGGPRQSQSLNARNVIAIDTKEVLDKRHILSIEKFDYKKLSKIDQYVKEKGAITFVMEDSNNAAEFVRDFNKFRKAYKCAAKLLTNTNSSDPASGADIIQTIVSIYDINYAIPIFNKKKADGIGIHLAMIWKELTENSHKIRPTCEAFVVLNQHESNLLVVDGQKTFKDCFLGNDYREHFHSYLRKEARRQADYKKFSANAKKKGLNPGKKPSSPTDSKKKDVYIKVDSANNYYTYSAYSSTTSTM